MPKAYDRVKNANNANDNFIKTPHWTNDVEDRFESWCKQGPPEDLATLLDRLLREDVAVSFKHFDGSICCTLAHQASREANLPYLLTGWSDGCETALAVALFKLAVMMKGVWEAPPAERVLRHR